jgi:hypothetical protein
MSRPRGSVLRDRVDPVGPWGQFVNGVLASHRPRWPYEEAAEAITREAVKDGERNAHFDRYNIRYWLLGSLPRRKNWKWMARGWNVTVEDIAAAIDEHLTWRSRQLHASAAPILQLTPPLHSTDGNRSILLTSSTPADYADALNLAGWIESTNTSDDAIEHLNLITLTAARHHVQQPPPSVIKTVLDVHRQIQSVLQTGRQRLRQTRELFRIDAQLLAHMCLLLGDLHRDQAALAYGNASIVAANEAGASPAHAFSAQAQIARWRKRYTEAADLAAAGYAASSPSSLRVLLACQEANAAALAGDTKRAHQALARAEAADGPDGPDSAWTCPPARHALYRLAVALHCGDPSEALHQAAIAKTAWTPGQAPPFGTSAHTRIAAGIAHLQLGAVDAAAEQVGPVLELPDEYRLATLIEHMASLDAQLRKSRFLDSIEGKQLSDRIAHFMRRAQRHLAVED